MNYRSAGVDISKGDRLVAKIKSMMGETGSRIGHFGGAVPLAVDQYREPLLVSSIDGVGTKTAVAMAMRQHRGVGRDMVHHSINDIACCGADPLFFLDYFAMGVMDVELAAEVIGGVVDACRRWDFPLIGGENAEMPDVYHQGEYDLVGSITGIVERSQYIDGSGIVEGDILIGFPSSGLHTNGYSLARRVVERSDVEYETVLPELGESVGSALLAEHRCYLGEIRELRNRAKLKGLAHITGGGLPGNVSRILPSGLTARFNWGEWVEPPVFDLLRRKGDIPEGDMRSTFNLGIGLVAVVDEATAREIEIDFPSDLYRPFRAGKVIRES